MVHILIVGVIKDILIRTLMAPDTNMVPDTNIVTLRDQISIVACSEIFKIKGISAAYIALQDLTVIEVTRTVSNHLVAENSEITVLLISVAFEKKDHAKDHAAGIRLT